jgi:hypothetical protein
MLDAGTHRCGRSTHGWRPRLARHDEESEETRGLMDITNGRPRCGKPHPADGGWPHCPGSA